MFPTLQAYRLSSTIPPLLPRECVFACIYAAMPMTPVQVHSISRATSTMETTAKRGRGSERQSTHRTQDARPRSRSSCSPGGRSCPDRPCRRGRRSFATREEAYQYVTFHYSIRNDGSRELSQAQSNVVDMQQARERLDGGKTETYAQNARLANQLDQAVLDAALGVALGVGLDVAKVADVAVRVGGGAVFFAEGVDCCGGGHVSQKNQSWYKIHAAAASTSWCGDLRPSIQPPPKRRLEEQRSPNTPPSEHSLSRSNSQ